MKPVTLSRRLQAVAAMVTAGNRVCDVGCDHGFVSVYLIEQAISPRVLAMDVKSGPLNAAREHIAEHNLEAVIETRLSDGLHNFNIGEAETLICAGMGGRLMMRILSDDKAKTDSFRELILQPQSEIEQFRAWLRTHGYRIAEENMIEEDGKFYPMMRAVSDSAEPDIKSYDYAEIYGRLRKMRAPGDAEIMQELNNTRNHMDDAGVCKLADRYGPFLLLHRDSTLAAYLRREERIYEGILSELRTQDLSDTKRNDRYEEVSQLLRECRVALEMVTEGETT